MIQHEWPAKDYALGSYIQSTVSDTYLNLFKPKPTDNILDIGCGDGGYSTKILNKIPQGNLVGVDLSENMLELAKEKIATYPNFSVQQADVLTMKFDEQFDDVVSFWCLQWCNNIGLAFKNIHKALKSGGRFFTIFPSGDDPFMGSYHAVRDSGKYPCLKNFVSPVDYQSMNNLDQKLQAISFKELHIQKPEQSITLPSLDVFRKFVNGIAFFNGQLSDDEIKMVNEAMVKVFESECIERYQGEYKFNFSIYLVSGEK